MKLPQGRQAGSRSRQAGREQEQAVRGLLPTWQKACGLITHGSQGAKKRRNTSKKLRGKEVGGRGEGRGGRLTCLGRVPGASVAPVDRMT